MYGFRLRVGRRSRSYEPRFPRRRGKRNPPPRERRGVRTFGDIHIVTDTHGDTKRMVTQTYGDIKGMVTATYGDIGLVTPTYGDMMGLVTSDNS